MITESQMIVRILVAAALGLIIGLEREWRDQDAGLRTHMILVIGAALAMTISINIAIQYYPSAPNGDPARLAAQVISGIGFLGAGVIFRYGANVRGLTTAVSLWTLAIVGLSVGAGFLWTAAAVTGILLVVLVVLDYIEDRFIPSQSRLNVTVWANYRPSVLEEVKEVFSHNKGRLGTLTIERDIRDGNVIYNFNMRLRQKTTENMIIDEVSNIPGVQKVKIN